jgi:hypothetical protein
VSASLEEELRAALEAASEFVHARPGLAERARLAARRRRRRLAAAIAATTAVLLVAAGGSYLLAVRLQSGPELSGQQHQPKSGPIYLKGLPADYQVQQLAVSGPYLYVLTNGPDVLSAYNRATGQLVRAVTVPAEPTGLAVGPGGLVWLVSTAAGGNSGGLWLLSPDLRLRSAYGAVQTNVILPVGRTTALTPTQDGLLTVRMPAPGQPGRATTHLAAGTSVGPSQNTAPGTSAALLVDGRVAVQVTNGYGYDSHITIAGHPGVRFGGSLRQQAGYVISMGGSLWISTFAIHNSYADASGPLVRLDSQLRATTPEFVRASPVLAKTEEIWADGDTVLAATAAAGHALVCFSARSATGPVATLPVSGQVVALAAAQDTVYVSTARSETNGAWAVASYPVPASCR